MPTLINLITLALLLAASSVHGEVYRWVDGNGAVRYSDTPPPSGKGRVDLVNSTPASPTGQAADWAEKDRDFRRRQLERQEAAKPAADARAAACSDARRMLQRLQGADGVVLYRTQKNGERVYISDEEREAMRKDAAGAVASNCSR